ncbi:MAG: hypothetical protein ISP71_01395 [Flavobacteriales bacterium]|nr:hypothetical protein [Flavobacteriales bacterium]
MRIFLLIPLTLILHSCVPEEDNSPQIIEEFYHINPPNWLYGSWTSGVDSNKVILHISEHNIEDVQENSSYNLKDSCIINNWETEESFIISTKYILNIPNFGEDKSYKMTFNYLSNTEFELEQNLIIFSGNTTTTFDTTNIYKRQ